MSMFSSISLDIIHFIHNDLQNSLSIHDHYLLVFGWPTVITAYSLLTTLNTASMRQTTDILQEVAKLIAGAMKKKEFDVDYTTLLGPYHPPYNDCTNLLESITNASNISLRSVVMLSEISENNMNSRKRRIIAFQLHTK